MGPSASKKTKTSNTLLTLNIEKPKLAQTESITEKNIQKKQEVNNEIMSTEIEIPEEIKAISEKINTEDFKILQIIGRGTFGKVMLVEHVGTGRLFALKTLRKTKIIKLLQVEHIKSERKYILE